MLYSKQAVVIETSLNIVELNMETALNTKMLNESLHYLGDVQCFLRVLSLYHAKQVSQQCNGLL